jgi:hypothetical protein
VGNRREEPQAERGKLRFLAPLRQNAPESTFSRCFSRGVVLRARLAGLFTSHAERSGWEPCQMHPIYRACDEKHLIAPGSGWHGVFLSSFYFLCFFLIFVYTLFLILFFLFLSFHSYFILFSIFYFLFIFLFHFCFFFLIYLFSIFYFSVSISIIIFLFFIFFLAVNICFLSMNFPSLVNIYFA